MVSFIVSRAQESARAIWSNRRTRIISSLTLAEFLLIGGTVGWGSAFAFTAALAALIYGILSITWINGQAAGIGRMASIADAIREGAEACLNCRDSVIAQVGALLFAILGIGLGWTIAFGFATGALLSAATGHIGMRIAQRADSRTAHAAQEGLNAAFMVVSRAGAVTGMLVIGLGLLGVAGYYSVLSMAGVRDALHPLLGLALGGSLISIFARLGGGMGAGWLSRPEARMAADLFETYAVTLVAAMLLGSLGAGGLESAASYPLVLGGVAIPASIVGTYCVKICEGKRILSGLYRGAIVAGGLSALAFYPLTQWIFGAGIRVDGVLLTANGIFCAALVGLGLTALIVAITEYYTAKQFDPVRRASRGSPSAHDIIAAPGAAMKATAAPVLAVCAGIWAAHELAGLYGIAIAATSMLSMAGMIVALDACGPITGDAGGSAEMAELPQAVRAFAGPLNTARNTAKAVAKGYAIAAAGLAALALFADYAYSLRGLSTLDLANPVVILGLFVGGLVPYLYGALALEAVDRLTRSAFRAMILPSLLPVAVPILVGWLLGRQALGGMLIGCILSGLFVAFSMTGGGAWDNGRSRIESGHFGGKGSAVHTVLDPIKDIAGPAVSPMIKIINLVALLMLPLL